MIILFIASGEEKDPIKKIRHIYLTVLRNNNKIIPLLLFAMRFFDTFRIGLRKKTISKRLRAEPSVLSPTQRYKTKKIANKKPMEKYKEFRLYAAWEVNYIKINENL